MKLSLGLAKTDPLQTFDLANDTLSENDCNKAWAAACSLFGAPWKNRKHWKDQPTKKTVSITTPVTETTKGTTTSTDSNNKKLTPKSTDPTTSARTHGGFFPMRGSRGTHATKCEFAGRMLCLTKPICMQKPSDHCWIQLRACCTTQRGWQDRMTREQNDCWAF